jgi:malonyl-CoA O-methyltransferase
VAIPERVDASIDTVRRQFERRAARFAGHDAIVRETERRLAERLAILRHPVRRLLDLGCGSGASRAMLRERFPDAQWIGMDASPAMLRGGRAPPGRLRRLLGRADDSGRVCASAERLPLPDASVDFVFSNLMLHWHPAPHEAIREMARVLRAGGLVQFSSYGPDTLQELRAACAQALPAAAPMPFVDMHDLGDMLVAAGFEAPVMEAEILTLTYADPRRLLAEARALGGNPRAARARGLPSGRQARALVQALAAGAQAGGRLALRFEIVVGHGWKAAPRLPGVATVAMPASRRG